MLIKTSFSSIPFDVIFEYFCPRVFTQIFLIMCFKASQAALVPIDPINDDTSGA